MSETCYEMLQNGVNRNGFVVYFNHKVPMKKFLADIEGLSASLRALNLVKGDVVTLYLPSCPQSLAVFYACSKLGIIANIVHPLIPTQLLAQNLKKVGSKALFFYDGLVRDEGVFEGLGQILIRCSISDYVTLRKPFYSLYVRVVNKRIKSAYVYSRLTNNGGQTYVSGKGADTVCFMHSGGTGGQPKIVRLANEAFNNTARSMIEMYKPDVKNGDYNLATLPIFHAYGLCAAMHTPLCFGCSLILVPQFRPRVVKRYFEKYRITIWSVVPAMLKKMESCRCLDNKGLKNLDVIWCGGDVLDESVVERVDGILAKYSHRAKLMRGYGLTEVCGVCVVNNYFYYKKGSCGKPMPGCSAQIWDERNNALSCNQMGEIAVCSVGNMQGYLDGGDCIEHVNGKLWIKTGDVGYLDEDGFLYIVDRKKRSLKIAAVNVFPAQIENCVKTLGFVDEACAVGVRIDGKQFIKVYITLKTPTDVRTAEKQVIEVCQNNLIRYSVPRFVEVISAMPRTPLGKIDYKSLEKRS